MNILEIKRMNYCYKQQFVLNDFELSIKEGSVYGLVGRPKSGKTTVLKLILGLLKTTSSTIYFKGQDFYGCRDKIRQIVGNIIDLPYYQNFLTVQENFKYIDMLFNYGDSRISEILRFIGLSKYTHTKVRKLTAVQQKYLSIGIALYHDPDLLVFDDLLRGLDEDSSSSLCSLLHKIKNHGKTILLSSRNSSELKDVCSHIGWLDSGCIRKEGAPEDFSLYSPSSLRAKAYNIIMPSQQIEKIKNNYAINRCLVTD